MTTNQKMQCLLLLAICVWATNASALNRCDNLALSPAATFFITGKIIDKNTAAPLHYATISIFNIKDKTLVNGNISDENGDFKIPLEPGNYYAIIEFLTYKSQEVKNIIINKNTGSLNLGMIVLMPTSTDLEEVTVRAEKSEMVLTLDKKVFHVGKDLAARGGTAVELLENVPSVLVDVEGNVSLRGNGGVQILVDGKPSILINSANGLRTLQANMIDRIEVITNPSARYEGDGTAGILNIILKKNRAKGVNGSFDVSLGHPRNYGLAFNLNYRAKKFNFFANYGFKYVKNPSEGSKFQRFSRNDSTFITSQYSKDIHKSLSNSVRVGADYFFNPKNILTTALHYRLSNDRYLTTYTYEDYLYDIDNPTSITLRSQDAAANEPALEYALTYKKTFEEKGRKWTVDVRYQDEISKENADLKNRFYNTELVADGRPDVRQQSNNRKKLGQSIFQTDYVHPFSKDHKFEAGLRNSIRTIDNNYKIEKWTDKGWGSLDDFTNHFKYNENISAAYLQYGNKFKQFSYLLGFRMEYSLISTQLSAEDIQKTKDYFTPIPTLHLSYDLPKNNAIQWSYSRRLRRPRFWDFNPFYAFSDDRNFFRGNPELDPEFSHNIELGHLKKWDKGSLNTSIYYRHKTGKIERIRRVEADGSFVTQPQNLHTEDAYGVELSATYSPFHWWRLNANFNFYQSIIDGTNIAPDLKSDTKTWFAKGSSKFTIKKKTKLQIRYYYGAPRLRPQGKDLDMYVIDVSASREILKDKSTLTLSIRDVFNSRRYRYIAEGFDFYTESEQQWQSRNITLALNYRLN